MRILTDIHSIDRNQWQTLVDRSVVASIFQTPAAYDFFASNGTYLPIVVAVEEDGELAGVIVALMQGEGRGLRRWLSTRAIINGGPLLDPAITPAAIAALLSATIDLLRHRCTYIETRNLDDYSAWRGVFEECGFRYVPHCNFHIDTSSATEVDRRMDKSRRRRIRRAFEAGATVSDDLRRLPDFYRILSDLYRTKIHKPLPPYALFEAAAREDFARYFFVVGPEGETVGGQLILMLGRRTAYAWYCCGLDHECHDLYPSTMANYAAIRHAADQGIARYDMMGAGEPGKDYGVRDFKAQFGGTLVEHGRYRHVNRPLVYAAGACLIKLKNILKP